MRILKLKQFNYLNHPVSPSNYFYRHYFESKITTKIYVGGVFLITNFTLPSLYKTIRVKLNNKKYCKS